MKALKILVATVFAIILIISLLYFSKSIYVVDQTQYAVKTRLGTVMKVIKDETTRIDIKIPFIDEVYQYPARLQFHDAPPEHIVTSDKKKLVVDNVFRWKIDDVKTFRNAVVNTETANRRLASIVHDAVKDVLGNTTLADAISEKQDSVLIKSITIADEKARKIGMKIVDIRFLKVQLPKSTELRLYERMKSERYREATTYRSQGREDSVRMVSETDKQVKIIEANAYKESKEIRGAAEALATEIYAKAYSLDPDFYGFYRTLETYRKSFDTATTIVISPKSELYKYLKSY